jgi:hypothetical protein
MFLSTSDAAIDEQGYGVTDQSMMMAMPPSD